MKLVVFTLLAAAITVQAAPKDKGYESFNECLDENNIKIDELEELEKKGDPRLHCFMACVFEKENMLKNGELDKATVVKVILRDATNIDEETVTKSVDACVEKAKDATDLCQLTNKVTMCLQESLNIQEPVNKD